MMLETDFCYRRIRWSGSPLYHAHARPVRKQMCNEPIRDLHLQIIGMILVSAFEELKPRILLGHDGGLELFAVLRHVRRHLVDDRRQIRRRQFEDVGIRRRRRRRPSDERIESVEQKIISSVSPHLAWTLTMPKKTPNMILCLLLHSF